MSMTRAALVTGASSGIGRAIAIALAEDGYAVTAAARRADRLHELETAAHERGQVLRGVAADLTLEEDIVRLVERHRRAFGRLDVLVNCSGHGDGGKPVVAQDVELMDRHWATNLRAPMILSRESFALLEKAGAEHGKALVINVASIAAKLGPPNMSAYGSTKAGMRAFTDSLRAEFTGK